MKPDVDEAMIVDRSVAASIALSVECFRSSRSGTLSTTNSAPPQASSMEEQIVSDPIASGAGSRPSCRQASSAFS